MVINCLIVVITQLVVIQCAANHLVIAIEKGNRRLTRQLVGTDDCGLIVGVVLHYCR